MEEYHSVQPYEAPAWAKRLTIKPSGRLVLCMRPTPIHKWELPGVPGDFQVWVKREDLTGSTLSGSEARKLEFLLADAVQQGCDTIVTHAASMVDENRCRATAVAARELGLKAHVIFQLGLHKDCIPCDGNMLPTRLAGATIGLANFDRYEFDPVVNMEDLVRDTERHIEKLKSSGLKPYHGVSDIGLWGYIDAFRELIDQGLFDRFDDVVLPVSSGGTAIGLAIANYLTGSKVKIHGVPHPWSSELVHYFLDPKLQAMGISEVKSHDIIDVLPPLDGDRAKETAELTVDVFTKTGIAISNTLTARAVRAMQTEMTTNPGRFAGKRVLFINTGGIFELYAGLDFDRQIIKDTAASNKVHYLEDVPVWSR